MCICTILISATGTIAQWTVIDAIGRMRVWKQKQKKKTSREINPGLFVI